MALAETSRKPPAKIPLPEDLDCRLFVLAISSNFIMYRLYTPTIYKNEVLTQEVTGLTSLPRDMHAARIRDLAARKRDHGLIDEIPQERTIKRPSNPVIILALIVTASAIFFYGQYNTAFRDQVILAWNTNQYYFIALGILFLAVFTFWLWQRRKRRKVQTE